MDFSSHPNRPPPRVGSQQMFHRWSICRQCSMSQNHSQKIRGDEFGRESERLELFGSRQPENDVVIIERAHANS